MIIIDGCLGEGGGQILRTSLTLASLLLVPIKIINIRANRNKPGLLRQHLTAVNACREITQAKVTNAFLGSQELTFEPKAITSGDYHFPIATAGSTTLVCQTVLPILMNAKSRSTVRFEGGTHNGMSPSLSFMEHSFLPLLKKLGLEYHLWKKRFGFYPAGGGEWTLMIEPTFNLMPINLTEKVKWLDPMLQGFVSGIPFSILTREWEIIKKEFSLTDDHSILQQVTSVGPGNALALLLNNGSHQICFDAIGKRGIPLESVAKNLCQRASAFIESGAMVDEYLADQLLLYLTIAKRGAFITNHVSQHCLTNIEVIRQITDLTLSVTEIKLNQFLIQI